MAIYKVVGVGEHGKYFDENSYDAVIHYIRSHAIFFGGNHIFDLSNAAQEMLDNAVRWNKNSRKRLRHSVLSFMRTDPITPIQANDMAQSCIQFYEEYQMVYAVHQNEEGVHIHFVMNQISLNGTRYRGQKADYYAFQNWLHAVTGRKIQLMTRND